MVEVDVVGVVATAPPGMERPHPEHGARIDAGAPPEDLEALPRMMSADDPMQLRLKARGADRFLDMWVGPAEAMAIQLGLRGEALPRPMTHDFVGNVLRALDDVGPVRVVLTKVESGTFYAELELRHGDRTLTVDCRPSDAIAVAVRLGIPVVATEAVASLFVAA